MPIRRKLVFVAALVFALLLAACGGTPGEVPDTPTPETPVSQKQVSIARFDRVIKNDDPSRNDNGATALLWSSISFADTGLEASDFASVRVISPSGRSWIHDETSNFEELYDSEENRFYIGNVYSTKLDGGSSVELGDYTVEVALKNGNTAKETLFVPAPGSTGTDGYEFAYTEDYSGAENPPSNYVALPKRATVINATLDAQASTLDVSFSVSDDVVYSGWLLLHDEAGKFIGYTEDFRNYETGAVMAQLNGDASLLTNGSTNTLTLAVSSEQLTLVDEASLSDVASISFILTDGKQYVGVESSYYDTRSRTAKFNVAVIE